MTATVGAIDSFIGLLRAACDDPTMNERLERLLSMPDGKRQVIYRCQRPQGLARIFSTRRVVE